MPIRFILSLLLMLFLPAGIDQVANTTFFNTYQDSRSLLYLKTYTHPYHEILVSVANLYPEETLTTEIYIESDHHGNTRLSDKPPTNHLQKFSTYQVTSEARGRFSVSRNAVLAAMLATWILCYFLLSLIRSPARLKQIVIITPRKLWRHLYENQKHPSNTDALIRRDVDYASPYQVLNISHTANQEEIKSAYKSAIQKYHPDRVSHLGEEIQKTAAQKTSDINQAYETIRKLRGF